MRSDVIVGHCGQRNADPCTLMWPSRNLLLLHLYISLCSLVSAWTRLRRAGWRTAEPWKELRSHRASRVTRVGRVGLHILYLKYCIVKDSREAREFRIRKRGGGGVPPRDDHLQVNGSDWSDPDPDKEIEGQNPGEWSSGRVRVQDKGFGGQRQCQYWSGRCLVKT